MSEGMIKAFLFYQRLARKEKPLLLLAGGQALHALRRWEAGPPRGGQGAGGRGPRSHTLPTPCHAPVCVWYGTYTPVWYIHAVNPARLPARSLSSGTLS